MVTGPSADGQDGGICTCSESSLLNIGTGVLVGACGGVGGIGIVVDNKWEATEPPCLEADPPCYVCCDGNEDLTGYFACVLEWQLWAGPPENDPCNPILACTGKCCDDEPAIVEMENPRCGPYYVLVCPT